MDYKRLQFPASLTNLWTSIRTFSACVLVLVPFASNAQSIVNQSAYKAPQFVAKFDQLVNHQVPLYLQFTRSNGETVPLSHFVNGKQPVILMMPFYKCKSGCLLEQRGLAGTINQMSYKLGTQFQVVEVSINPYEGPSLSSQEKKYYTGMLKDSKGASGWHFMTGTEANIKALTTAIGMHYEQDLDTQQFNHPTGILILEPNGRIFQYMFGTTYDPKDLQIALTKASNGAVGSVIQQFISSCCTWNPTTGHYDVMINKIIDVAATATVLLMITVISAMFIVDRRRHKLKRAEAEMKTNLV